VLGACEASVRMRAPLHLFSSAARSRFHSAPPCKIWGRALYGRSQKRGSSSARARRRCQGRTGYSWEKHIHTPPSPSYKHIRQKTKATLREERNGREGACGEEQGLLQTFVCFLETLEREGIKWSGRGSEAREARPPAATGKAVLAPERGETCWDHCIEVGNKKQKTTTTYDNIPPAERSNGVLRADGTCGPSVTGGEYVGCACLCAWCGEWASVTRVKRCNGVKWWSECQLSWCLHIAQVCVCVCMWVSEGEDEEEEWLSVLRKLWVAGHRLRGQKTLVLREANTHTRSLSFALTHHPPKPRPQLHTHSFTQSNNTNDVIWRYSVCAVLRIFISPRVLLVLGARRLRCGIWRWGMQSAYHSAPGLQ